MNIKLLALTVAIAAATGCSSNNKSSGQPPVVSDGAVPEQYVFTNSAGESTVSYTGQTKRHVLISDMTAEIGNLTEAADADVVTSLNEYMQDAKNGTPLFSLTNGEPIEPVDANGVFTYDAIAGDKALNEKIAGGYYKDDVLTGESNKLIDDMFFGWNDGIADNARPIDLVDYFIAQLQSAATDGNTPQVSTATGEQSVDVVYVDQYGRDYKQLMQKFLLMSVTFSQGTNDYLQSDFASEITPVEGKAYTVAEHHWDEAFGYFGAARDYADYTDVEIAAGEYRDTDNSATIDIRSEYNFGQSTNCAKRDKGTAGNSNPTNFTKEAFDAFLTGRQILRDAAAAGELTTEAEAALQIQIQTAAVTWEKCIAATVVHYINDVIDDSVEGTFTSVDHFQNLAKHWSEMKGFALGLQFNPHSPFRTSTDVNIMDLQMVLAWMGDAPVLADGTQLGQPYEGGVAGYEANLLQARAILQQAYDFDQENVENW